MITTELRNATLEELVEKLDADHALKNDMVVPATSLTSRGGVLHVAGDATITENGVSSSSSYRPNRVMLDGVAAKLDIPGRYVRRLHVDRPDLFDANVNGLLRGRSRRAANGDTEVIYEPDARSFLVRTYRDPEGGAGIGRALLSDRYGIVDNLDAIVAVLAGVKESGEEVHVVNAHVTEQRMYVQFAAPQVQAHAEKLLEGYRNPFRDEEQNTRRGGDSAWQRILEAHQAYDPDYTPVVHAGFTVTNSEVGAGSFQIIPEIVVQVCRNGLKLPAAALRKTHLGARMDEGSIRWEEDTQRKGMELARSQARDAVRSFVSPEFLSEQVATLEEKAGKRVRKPEDTIEYIGKKLQFSEPERESVLAHFILGGQMTAGGVANAITSASQTLDSADRAHHLDTSAVAAMELV